MTKDFTKLLTLECSRKMDFLKSKMAMLEKLEGFLAECAENHCPFNVNTVGKRIGVAEFFNEKNDWTYTEEALRLHNMVGQLLSELCRQRVIREYTSLYPVRASEHQHGPLTYYIP